MNLEGEIVICGGSLTCSIHNLILLQMLLFITKFLNTVFYCGLLHHNVLMITQKEGMLEYLKDVLKVSRTVHVMVVM